MDRLVREIDRSEVQAIGHARRLETLLGTVPPVEALAAVGEHAHALRPRFEAIVHAYDLQLRRGAGATTSTLRALVSDRIVDAERAYRTCLLDLRHGLDVVRLARQVARDEELFGVIRWCDDWLGARRTLIARVEARLAWFVEDAGIVIQPSTVWHDDRTTEE